MRYGPRQIAQLRAGQIPVPTPRKKRDNAEFRIQAAFVALWRANAKSFGIAPCLGFHVPNALEGSRFEGERAIRGKMRKLMGVEPGVCDWILLVPKGKWSALLIEFKKPGGVASEAQEQFMGFATTRGYKCEVHTDSGEAWISLLDYLNQP